MRTTTRSTARRVLATTVLALTATACATAADQGEASGTRSCPALAAPADGVLLGVNLDWSRQGLAEYTALRGHRPAVAVSFAGFPLPEQGIADVDAAVGTSDVAISLGRKPASLSPARDSLIKKGLVYSAERGQIAFTVPHFGRYLLRHATD